MKPTSKLFLPDYFDESRLTKEEKEALNNEKALQKALRNGDREVTKDLYKKCSKYWGDLYRPHKEAVKKRKQLRKV